MTATGSSHGRRASTWLGLAIRWGVLDLHGKSVRLVNWRIVGSVPIGQPGLVLVEDGGGGAVAIEYPTIEDSEVVPVAELFMGMIRDALDEHEASS